jgi:membrane protein YdbS with pleckstrin-like domain
MDSDYPVEDEIFVLKGDERHGPFHIDELLEGIDEGLFSYDDVCLRSGAAECERLREILDWEKPGEKVTAAEHIEEDPSDEEEEIFEEEEDATDHPLKSPTATLYAGHPSILNSPGSILAIAIGFAGGLWVYSMNPWLTLFGFLVGIFALVNLSLIRFTSDYHITPKRIEVTKGLITRSSSEVRIQDIRAINVSCRGIAGVIGIGTVDFFTAGDDPEVTFEQIWAAKDVKILVRRIQDTL